MAMDLIAIMNWLYASEINCEVASFWDGGWQARIGDWQNGYKAEDHGFTSLEDVAAWLDKMARMHYPESDYAKRLSVAA
jgi:hypothetical protein